MNDFLHLFMNSETPFLLLFVALFWFYIREAKAREIRSEKSKNEALDKISSQIDTVQQDLKVMLSIWKILIDSELERRKEE